MKLIVSDELNEYPPGKEPLSVVGAPDIELYEIDGTSTFET